MRDYASGFGAGGRREVDVTPYSKRAVGGLGECMDARYRVDWEVLSALASSEPPARKVYYWSMLTMDAYVAYLYALTSLAMNASSYCQ